MFDHAGYLATLPRVWVMDLSDASKRIGAKVDGFIGTDVLSEFSAARIDYKAQTVTLEK